MKKVAYAGWQNCQRIANKSVEVIVTGDVGPRVIRFALLGGDNVFREYPEHAGRTGGDDWRIYGGHRLWHSPEDPVRTYYPDNGPVSFEPLEAGLRVIQPAEITTGIQKEIDLELVGESAEVKITHRLRNAGLWPVTLAPWALSVMREGGTAVIPLPEPGSHQGNLTPVSTLALWAYSNLSDPRWTFGRRYLLLRQDPAAKVPVKIGACVKQGWAGYVNAGVLFLKRFDVCPCGSYPDFGCSVEAYTNNEMLELETLGPVTTLSPSAVTEHVERWSLAPNVTTPKNDDDVERIISSLCPSGSERGRAGQAR